MKYYMMHKEPDAEAVEITKEEARNILDGNWSKEALDDIFDQGLMFRLYTLCSEVWSQSDDGKVIEEGIYGF